MLVEFTEKQLRYQLKAWCLFPYTRLLIGNSPPSLKTNPENQVAYVGQSNGTFLPLSGPTAIKNSDKDRSYTVSLSANEAIFNTSTGEISGSTNSTNQRLYYQSGQLVLQLGDGTQRIFEPSSPPPSSGFLEDELATHISELEAPSHYRLIREYLPSGNQVHYHYGQSGHLALIELKAAGVITGWIQLAWSDQTLTITTSQDDTITYLFGKGSLKQVSGNPMFMTQYRYDDRGNLVEEAVEDKLVRAIHYDKDNRVSSIHTLQADGSGLGERLSFSYTKRKTIVQFPGEKRGSLLFDAQSRLIETSSYQKNKRMNTQRKFWVTGSHGEQRLRSDSVENSFGTVQYVRTLDYDSWGNITREAFYGPSTGANETSPECNSEGIPQNTKEVDSYEKVYSYSQDGWNLLIERQDEKQSSIRYDYQPNTNLLSSTFIKSQGKTVGRKFYTYNEAGACVEMIEDDGCDESPSSLKSVSERHIIRREVDQQGLPRVIEHRYLNNSIHETPLLERWEQTFDTRKNLLARARCDANGSPYYVECWDVDSKGNVLNHVDRNGHATYYSYDSWGNCIRLEQPYRARILKLTRDSWGRTTNIEESRNGEVRWAKITLDGHGLYTHVHDWRGAEYTYEYDIFGRLNQVIEPEIADNKSSLIRPNWRIEYSRLDNCEHLYDPLNRLTTAHLTCLGKPWKVTHPDGSYELYRYDPEGSLYATRTRDGLIPVLSYDSQGNLDFRRIHRQNTDGTQDVRLAEQHWFNKTPTHSEMRVNDRMCLQYTQDGAGRFTQQVGPNGEGREEVEYDSLGRLAVRKMSTGPRDLERYEHYSYDTWDRITNIEVTDHNRQSLTDWSLTYDDWGNLIQIDRTVAGISHQLCARRYSPWGDLLSSQESTGPKTILDHSLGRGPDGQIVQLVRTIQPDSSSVINTLDLLDRLVAKVTYDPDGKCLLEERISYDLVGNELSHIYLPSEGADYTITRTYDDANRLLSLDENGSLTTIYSYDDRGRLDTVDLGERHSPIKFIYRGDDISATYNHSEVFHYQYQPYSGGSYEISSVGIQEIRRNYDLFGQLISEEVRIPRSSIKLTLQFAYDPSGRLKSILLPDKSKILYQYDTLHCTAVQRLNPRGGQIYQHRYTDFDHHDRTSCELLAGALGERLTTRDPLGRPIALETDLYTSQVFSTDQIGRPTTIETCDDQNSKIAHYAYDNYGHLTSEPGSARRYDSLGRLIESNEVPVKHASLGQVTETEKVEYQYDPYGLPISRRGPTDNCSFHFDPFQRLKKLELEQGSIIEYVYDCWGRLQNRIVHQKDSNHIIANEYYAYYGDQLIGIFDESGNIKLLRIPHSDGRSIQTQSVAFEIEGTPYVPIHDLQGNVVLLCDLDGEVVERYNYTAFGEEQIFNGDNTPIPCSQIGNPWRFREKSTDELTGLIDFGHRFYDPAIGCFISPDPAGLIDGPNRYCFAHNNPLSYTDVFGLTATADPSRVESAFFNKDDYQRIESRCACHVHRTCQRGGSLSNASVRGGTVWHNIDSIMRSGDGLIIPFFEGMAQADFDTLGQQRFIEPGASYPCRKVIATLAPQLDSCVQHYDTLDMHQRAALITQGLLHAGGYVTATTINMGVALSIIFPQTRPLAATAAVAKTMATRRFVPLRSGLPIVTETIKEVETLTPAITRTNTTVGWKLGDPINNLTRAGKEPSWSAVRARLWKAEVQQNPHKYSTENLERMRKGLAPRKWNIEKGQWESMEWHHDPPQRDGNLFDVKPYWPEDHARVDMHRRLGN